MRDLSPFNAWMRKQAEEPDPVKESLGFIRNSFDPKEIADYKSKMLQHTLGTAREKAAPFVQNAIGGSVGSYLGNLVKPATPVGPAPVAPQPNMERIKEQAVGQGGLSGYLGAFQRAHGVDTATSQYLDPQGKLKVQEFAKARNINIDPSTQDGMINLKALQDPRFLGQRQQALRQAGQGAWNWAKENPWLVAGGLGLAGLAGASLMGGGDDDEDEDQPQRQRPNWTDSRYWRRS